MSSKLEGRLWRARNLWLIIVPLFLLLIWGVKGRPMLFGKSTLWTRQGHGNAVTSLAFSADGKLLATGGRDKTVRLWDVQTGREIRVLREDNPVLSVAFSPNSKTLASISFEAERANGKLRLWDPRTGILLRALAQTGYGQKGIAFSPNGDVLACGTNDMMTVQLRDAQTGVLLRTLKETSAPLCFSPDGILLACGDWEGKVKLWDARTGAALQTLAIPEPVKPGAQVGAAYEKDVMALSFSPDGKTLYVASRSASGGVLRLWNPQTRTLLKTINQFNAESMALSPDGTVLASGARSGKVTLWSTQTWTVQHTFISGSGIVSSIAFSPNSKTLASSGMDGTVKLWEVE